MKIWVGTIIHEYGSTMYASRSKEGLFAQLAGFCRQYWGDREGDAPTDNQQCMDAYFEDDTEGESLEYEEVELDPGVSIPCEDSDKSAYVSDLVGELGTEGAK